MFQAKNVICCSFAVVNPPPTTELAFNFVELKTIDILYEKFSSVSYLLSRNNLDRQHWVRHSSYATQQNFSGVNKTTLIYSSRRSEQCIAVKNWGVCLFIISKVEAWSALLRHNLAVPDSCAKVSTGSGGPGFAPRLYFAGTAPHWVGASPALPEECLFTLAHQKRTCNGN